MTTMVEGLLKIQEHKELKLLLGVILESHKKGYSNLTPPIVKKIEELLGEKEN